MCSDLYANVTGIFDLSQRDIRPLHSVAMHDSEENGFNSALFDALRLYRDNKVFQHFGLSWNDMKNLFHEEFMMIMELSAEMCRTEQQRANQSLTEIQQLTGKK